MIPTLRVDEGLVPDHLIGLMAAMIIDVVAAESAVGVIRWEIMRMVINIIAPHLDIIITTREDTMTGEVVEGGGDIAVEVMDTTKMDIITIITNIRLRGGGDFVEKGRIHP